MDIKCVSSEHLLALSTSTAEKCLTEILHALNDKLIRSTLLWVALK